MCAYLHQDCSIHDIQQVNAKQYTSSTYLCLRTQTYKMDITQ